MGAEAALAGLRAADVGGETATDLLNPLAKDLGSETTDLTNPAERDILDELDLEKNAERDLGEETQAERDLTEEGNAEKDLTEEDLTENDLEKGSRLRNTLLKISKYGTLGAIGIGIGVPFALSLFGGGKGRTNQTQTQTTQNYPIPFLLAKSSTICITSLFILNETVTVQSNSISNSFSFTFFTFLNESCIFIFLPSILDSMLEYISITLSISYPFFNTALASSLKLQRLKDEIKVLEKEKKEILQKMKTVNVYEELDNKAKIISEKVEEIKKFFMEYIKIANPNEDEKNLLKQNFLFHIISIFSFSTSSIS